jgi:hypothetical protein
MLKEYDTFSTELPRASAYRDLWKTLWKLALAEAAPQLGRIYLDELARDALPASICK